MRVFVALDLAYPPRLAESAGPAPAHFHLTLRFLGEIPAEDGPTVTTAAATAASGFPPFELELLGLGAFPSRGSPKVIWVGVGAGAPESVALAGRLSEALAAAGIPGDDRPFRPHATLRRIRRASDRAWAEPLLRDGGALSFGRQRIDAVRVYESELSSAGAEHRPLASVPLGGPVS